MEQSAPYGAMDLNGLVRATAALLGELNVGLFIYHLEDEARADSLRLVYANRAASEYTKARLDGTVGRLIHDAFPGLVSSGLAETFAEVVRTERARNLGAFEYAGDAQVEKGHYAVKAFPMPAGCVGVVFENISTRKQVETLLRRQRRPDERR